MFVRDETDLERFILFFADERAATALWWEEAVNVLAHHFEIVGRN